MICGYATPEKIAGCQSCSKFTVKKTFPVAIENKNNGQADCYTINNRTRFPLTIIHSFAVAENSTSLLLYHYCRSIAAVKGVERVLKDHLLHLFPSHYFW